MRIDEDRATLFFAVLGFQTSFLAYQTRRGVADFQALQFRVADIVTSLETAHSMLWRAASALDEKSPKATLLRAIAKRVATDAGVNAANDALQLFGGHGYLADCRVQKIVRDLRVHQILEGTNEIMRVIVARGLRAIRNVAKGR